jgi:ABC-type nitrate/sulfonate/bicarbonate transport system ATPase subunit
MLELNKVSKRYKQPDDTERVVIDNMSLTIEDNQFVVFLGPSGCGKSTLLKLIAGLISPSQGSIVLNHHDISGPSREKGVVFQQFSLFPWLTVAQNILFGPKLHQLNQQEQDKILQHYLSCTQLQDFASYYPDSLSGGMQQRVAIARTLANNPDLLLMDEPFGSLDLQIREQMQDLVARLYDSEKKTIIFITHDISEAVLLADTVIVMSANPMTIKSRFNIPLARPRHHSLKYTNEFFDLEKMIALALGDAQ